MGRFAADVQAHFRERLATLAPDFDWTTEHRIGRTPVDVAEWTELAALRQAAWLFEREFEADVTIVPTDDADESVAKEATPGQPAIPVHES